MARINIEDQLFTDGRFIALVSIVGSMDVALGKMVNAFRVAQSFYIKGQNIPESIFNGARLHPLLEVGLAVKHEDGTYYICGSKNQFSWIEKRKESGKKGGFASGIKRKSKQIEANRSKIEAKAKQTESKEEASPNDCPSKTKPQSQSQSQSQSLNTNKYIVDRPADEAYIHPLDIPDDPVFNKKWLEHIYNAYPKKEGKKKGMEALSRKVKDQETFEKVMLAVDNYSKLCADKERQFIKQFSSFVSVWEDYLEMDFSEEGIPDEVDWDSVEVDPYLDDILKKDMETT